MKGDQKSNGKEHLPVQLPTDRFGGGWATNVENLQKSNWIISPMMKGVKKSTRISDATVDGSKNPASQLRLVVEIPLFTTGLFVHPKTVVFFGSLFEKIRDPRHPTGVPMCCPHFFTSTSKTLIHDIPRDSQTAQMTWTRFFPFVTRIWLFYSWPFQGWKRDLHLGDLKRSRMEEAGIGSLKSQDKVSCFTFFFSC